MPSPAKLLTRVLLAGAVLVSLPGHRAQADDAPPVRALLADPVALATWLAARDPMVDAARARVDAATAAGRQARVRPNPQLQASLGGLVLGATNPSSPGLGLRDTTNVNLGVNELFEIGKRGPRRSAADLRTQEAGEAAVGTLGARLGQATSILGKLAYVAARRAAVAANLEDARKLQALEKNRLDNKDLSGSEYARIELETQQLELELGRADADVSAEVASCSAILRAPCAAASLDPSTLDGGAPLPEALPAAGAAIDGRPARQASKLEAQALGWDATLAEHRRIPDPTVGLSYTYDNLIVAGNQAQTVLFSLSLPLPVFDRGDHDAAAARANARAVQAEDRAVVDEAVGLVEALAAQRETLKTTLTRLDQESVPRSTQILAQTRRSFDLGQASLADLLLAERAHRELLLEVLDTRFDLFNVRAALRQALGLDDLIARDAARSPR